METIRKGSASTRVEEVYAQLRADVVEGRLQPGAKLMLTPLCQRFSVSLSVVREALTRLAEQKLARAMPQQGFMVMPLSRTHLLELTDAHVCLDTGHFVVGGGDPVAALREFGPRVNHVHLKDASRDVVAAIVADGDPVEAVWTREAFPRLGAGDVDIDAVLAVLRDTGWSGWLVVEQDTLPTTPERFARAAEDQRANRAFLTARGL